MKHETPKKGRLKKRVGSKKRFEKKAEVRLIYELLVEYKLLADCYLHNSFNYPNNTALEADFLCDSSSISTIPFLTT